MRILKKFYMLKQQDFERLLKLPKKFSTDDILDISIAPSNWTRKVISIESDDEFLMDFYRGSYDLSRFTINKRYKTNIVLLRFDSGGMHKNPDEKTIKGAHIHIYKEGYGDKFAYPITDFGITKSNYTIKEIFIMLLKFCNFVEIPDFK